MPNKLFDEDSDDEANKSNKLIINKNYADNYGKWRQKEEYEHLKAKHGVKDFDSDKSDSEESEDEEYVEPDNPEFDKDFFRVLAAVKTKHPILEEREKFFKDSYQSKIKSKEKEEKPLLVADYERKNLLEKGGKYDDESIKPGPSRLVKENECLLNSKEKFKFDDNLSDDNDDEEDLFTLKENLHNSMEDHKEDNEAVEFLKGKREKLNDKLDEELFSALKKDWETNMPKEDKYLMDFFVNKRYLEEEDETKERADNHYVLDFEPLEDDEDTYNKMEEYETKYRFRFEEPDQEFIHRFPRSIEETVRKKDIRRKEERDKKKNKLKEEEERNKQELLRLKALKKQEILERIEMLKETAGIEKYLDPNNFDLEADFDPERHDALMSGVFNDEYYDEEEEEGTSKPKFEDEEFQRELEQEYEKLKELDNMAEGTFKYAEVAPISYGLSTEEILFAKDTELNRWCSINRILKCGQGEIEERKMKKNFDNRGANEHIKFKILPSLYSDKIEEHWEVEEERRRKKNLKKKERKRKKMLKMEEQEGETASDSYKSNSENHDTLKTENISDSNGTRIGDFEREKSSKTDSTDDTTENESSFSNYNNTSTSEEQNSFNENITKILKKKKKQKFDDSSISIEKCSEGETLENEHSIQNNQQSDDHALDEAPEKTLKNDKKKKRKKSLGDNVKIENLDVKSNVEETNNSLKERLDECSESGYKKMNKQNNSIHIPQKPKNKKRKRPISDNDNESKNESNKKAKKANPSTNPPNDMLEMMNHFKKFGDSMILAFDRNPKKIVKKLKYRSRCK